jgi:hypothetical protein
MASQISDLARNVGFKGNSGFRVAEPHNVTTLPVIDNTVPGSPNIRTSVDTYVHGQYIGKNGQIHEVRQRYTIFVSYGGATQNQTMEQTRSVIASDFSNRYGRTFNITSVFVPMLRSAPDAAEDMQFYGGSRTFKGRFDRVKWELDTERAKFSTNTTNIKRRYSL